MLAAAALAASDASAQRPVVRVYDVRITGVMNASYFERRTCSDRHPKTTMRSSTRHTWSSVHRGVLLTFGTGRIGRFDIGGGSVQHGRMTRSVRYQDDGLSCTSLPPCRFERTHVVPSVFQVSPLGLHLGQYIMGFNVAAASPAGIDTGDACGGQYAPEVQDRGIDVTRSRKGSRHRIVHSTWLYTSVSTYTRTRPSAATLPYPFDLLYAGKPVAIRVTDTKDESRLSESSVGTLTIVFQPRRSR